jgi:hypothetical protein
MSVFIGSIKSNPTDKDFDKYVKKSVKLIKSSPNFNNAKDIEGISNMFAMDMARDFKGSIGRDYQLAIKKYKVVILKKVKEKI